MHLFFFYNHDNLTDSFYLWSCQFSHTYFTFISLGSLINMYCLGSVLSFYMKSRLIASPSFIFFLSVFTEIDNFSLDLEFSHVDWPLCQCTDCIRSVYSGCRHWRLVSSWWLSSKVWWLYLNLDFLIKIEFFM